MIGWTYSLKDLENLIDALIMQIKTAEVLCLRTLASLSHGVTVGPRLLYECLP
jgi:hypothetical protein